MSSRIVVLTAMIGLVGVGLCSGSVIGSEYLGIFAGGNFSTDQGVTIKSSVGAGGTSYLAKNTSISGDIYSVGNFSIDQKVEVKGLAFSSNSIWLGKQSTLGEVQGWGTVGLDQQVTINGDLQSAKEVTIGKSSIINGDVNYGTSLWTDSGVKVSGTKTQGGLDLATWKPTLRTSPATWSTSNDSLYYASKSTKTLAPGTYGSLSVDSSSTIYLSSGTYNFSSLWLGKSVKLIADTSKGNVVVNILNGMSTDSSVLLDGGDTNNLIINSKGSIYLGQGTVADANLFSYEGPINIDRNSQITGSLYSAKDIYLASFVTVDASSAIASVGSSTIPEPTTMGLFTMGIVAVLRRRIVK